MIKIARTFKRFSVEKLDKGYIDKTTYYYQSLCISLYIFGFKVFSYPMLTEQITAGIYFQYCTLGFTDWRSPNSEIIDFWVDNPLIFSLL